MQIELTQGETTSVSDVDADLAAFSWSVKKGRGATRYAHRGCRRPDGKWTTERLHQVIARRMGIAGEPDHKDRNGLNNHRENLRPANDSQNQGNVGIQTNNTSGFKGVSFRRDRAKWIAYIRVDRKRIHLGYFDDPIEAALAYDVAALKHFGEFAALNFPAPVTETQMESMK